jgi:hypothetical protein
MQLFEDIKQILSEVRPRTYKTVNAILLPTYWQIGRCIVENAQNGQKWAEYGKKLSFPNLERSAYRIKLVI